MTHLSGRRDSLLEWNDRYSSAAESHHNVQTTTSSQIFFEFEFKYHIVCVETEFLSLSTSRRLTWADLDFTDAEAFQFCHVSSAESRIHLMLMSGFSLGRN